MAKPQKQHESSFLDRFKAFVEEFKNESDRAAVILGAAKVDSLLAQILDRHLRPSLSSNDELLDGDSPLSTFSSRINVSYRLGLITADFAKSLHLLRRIRNSFAHEVSGVSLESGPHADRVTSLLLPLRKLPFFKFFRDGLIGESSASNDFRACIALMAGRLEARLEKTEPVTSDDAWSFWTKAWADFEHNEEDAADASAT